MKWTCHTLIFSIMVLIIAGCKQNPDFDKYRSEILGLHKELIKAHRIRDVDFFVKDIAEDYFSVGNGEINHPKKEEIFERFSNYLNNTEFREYKDLQDPIIGFSEDGSIAWSIVQVKVAGFRSMNEGDIDFDYTFAWITLYSRQDDKWIRLGEVSNYK